MITFNCAPSSTSSGNGKVRTSYEKSFSIDIHCHVHTEEAAKLAEDAFSPEKEPALRHATMHSNQVNQKQMADLHPKLTQLSERIADMDQMGINIQAISPSPFQFYYYTEPELGRILSRTVNENLATAASKYPDRFVPFGTVPLQDPRLAVEELSYCVKELGMKGIEISSQVNGTELTNADLEPFWSKVCELDVLLFMHPLGFTEGTRLTDHYFNNIIGNPLESTLAVSHMIFDGVFERHQKLKLCVAHGGGYLPTYARRMDHAHAVRPDCREKIEKAPTEYLKQVYFDSVVFDPEHLAHLVRLYGADHVLLGTDYPYDMGESDPVGLIDRVSSISATEREKIVGGNALRLLGLELND